MKISVITPSFNSGKFLEKAICSVLDQDYSSYEHIIIDGGSTDQTLEILGKYPHLIWESEKDRGQVHAMNKGFARATGDIIVYLNADDYFLCGAFSSVIPFFLQNHKFVVGDIIVQKPGEYFVNVPRIRLSEMIRHWEMNAFPYNPVGYFYRREVQENVPFDENFPNMMDLRFLLESATKYTFTKINTLLGVYRCFEETKTLEDQKNSDYWTHENFKFIDAYLKILPKVDRINYEKDREDGYRLQRQWRHQGEIDAGKGSLPAITKPTAWANVKKILRSRLRPGGMSATHQLTPNRSWNASDHQLERYQERALDVAMSHTDFRNKTILEIGGDTKFQVAREMVRRGAKHVLSINYSPYFSSKKITDSIESINMDIRQLDQLHESFDIAFGVAILEHLNNLDVVLNKIYMRLNKEGVVYLHGGPIWTSFLGHHVWVHTSDGCKYEFNNNNPIPDWGHLLYTANEMHDILASSGIPGDHCNLIIEYIYDSERLSRYTVNDLNDYAIKSDFVVAAMNKIQWKLPDEKTQIRLESKIHSNYADFGTGEIELILKK